MNIARNDSSCHWYLQSERLTERVLFYLSKMADASSTVRVKKIPDNLYEVCLTNLVNYLQKSKCERNDLRSLPDSILMDVYYKVSAKLIVLIYKNSLTKMHRYSSIFIHLMVRILVIYNICLVSGHGHVMAIGASVNHFHWLASSFVIRSSVLCCETYRVKIIQYVYYPFSFDWYF